MSFDFEKVRALFSFGTTPHWYLFLYAIFLYDTWVFLVLYVSIEIGGGCIMPKSRNCHYDIPRPLTIKTNKTKKSLIVLWFYAPNLLVRHEELD